MNAYLEFRYSLSSLASNSWCRDANAAIAVYLLAIRRGETAPAVLQEQYDAYFAELHEIAAGRLNLPGVSSATTGLSVTNFQFDIQQSRACHGANSHHRTTSSAGRNLFDESLQQIA